MKERVREKVQASKSDDHMACTDVSEMKTECLLRFIELILSALP